MATKLFSVDGFKAAAKDGARPEGAVFRLAPFDQRSGAEPEVAADDTRVIRFIFSDDTVDRAGDRILQDGWEVADFKRNPVALWAHSSWEPPIGRAENVGVKDGKLVGDIAFAAAEVYAFADTIYRLVKGKFLRAVSVGFLPTEYKFVESKERPWGIDFIKQSLLEISLCPIPCNPNALQEAKSHGIDVTPLREWASKVLDEGGSVLIPRELLEETFRAAKTPKTVRRLYLEADVCAAPSGAGSASRGTKAETEEAPASWPAASADFDKSSGAAAQEALRLEAEAAEAARSAAGLAAEVEAAGATAAAVTCTCNRAKDAECGMKDPQECAVHKTPPPAKTAKSGKRISAATKASLEKALDHHASATKCIKDVLDEPDDDEDQLEDLTVDPEKQRAERLRKAKALRKSLLLTD